jgi:hypothetical protein
MASGTPAASAGASDGALNADFQIDRLLKKHVASEVQKYLRSIASTPAAKQRMRPYFHEPTPEVVKVKPGDFQIKNFNDSDGDVGQLAS